MKRLVSLLLILTLVAAYLPAPAYAEEHIMLVTRGDKVIYDNTTLDEIRQMYGQEKFRTPSYFGGDACTFYGENYSDLLFVDTTADGVVASYCTFGGDFQSYAGNSGDRYTHRVYTDQYTDDDFIIRGVSGVNFTIFDPFHYPTWEAPYEWYESDPDYAFYVAQHGAILWNAVASYAGKQTNVTIDERTYYFNRQLMDNGTNIYHYCKAIKQENQFYRYTYDSDNPHGWLSEYETMKQWRKYPTPGMFADYAAGYTTPEETYPIFDFSWEHGLFVGFLRKWFYAESKRLPYTQEEWNTINRIRESYAETSALYRNAETYFDEKPQSDTLPLVAGKINRDIGLGATGYLNAIRMGAGLPELEWSEELSDYAMHKATLLTYMTKNNIPFASGHYPPRPEGVSEEFYNKAQSGGNENLYYGNAVGSIQNALADFSSPYSLGHRYNLLTPYATQFGVGFSDGDGAYQGVHKISGRRDSDMELVAWPPAGIMLDESGGGKGTIYSARFYKNYAFTEDSGVIFRCLNTGETFVFDPKDSKNNNQHRINVELSSSGVLSYCDAQLAMNLGMIYEITLTNVRNLSTGELTDYTYRSIYEKAYFPVDVYGGYDLEAAIADSSISAVAMDRSTLYLGVGEKQKLTAKIEHNYESNLTVAWSSSDPSVATVNEAGHVTAHKEGTAVITAQTFDRKTCQCVVTVRPAPTAITMDQPTVDIPLGETYTLSATVTPVLEPKAEAIWRSLHPSVASVDQNGLVTPQKIGKTPIFASTYNGKTDQCLVRVVPQKPLNLSISSYDHLPTSLHIGWDDVYGATGYEVWRQQGEEPAVLVAENLKPSNYLDENLQKNTTYTYLVRAYKDVDGERFFSAFSAPASGTTPMGHVHVHDYHITEVIEPTCASEGYTFHLCSCGDYYMDNFVPPLPHEWGVWRTQTAATCEEGGVRYRECFYCFTKDYQDIAPLGHKWDQGVVTQEPTEDSEGVMTYTCARCKATRTETIPALGHTHSYTDVVTAPTCTEQGYTTHTCTCGDSYVDGYVSALGHAEVKDAAKAPTCTETGLTEGKHCSRCNEVLVMQEVVPALGHAEVKDAAKASTCTEPGLTEGKHCSRCNEVLVKQEAIPALGHIEVIDEAVAPTCLDDGLTEGRHCSRCNEVLIKQETVPALGHDWDEGVVTLEPTEETDGSRLYTCARCGETQTEIIPALNHVHSYIDTITAPTCTEQGYTTYTCTCGDSYVDAYVAALGHDYGEGIVTKEATEVAEGERTYTCSRCSDSYTEATPVLECPGKDFTDMPAYGNWAHEPIDWAVKNGITNGTSATTFGPGKACTRGQVVTFLWRAAGCPEPQSTANPFTDVKEGDFYYKAVLWAVEKGITKGVSADKFGPSKPCTRGQVVTFQYRAHGSPAVSGTNSFEDVKSTDFYADAVIWAVQNDITNGTSATKFSPSNTCTRAQIVTFLWRAFK